MVKMSPSILSADLLRIGEHVKTVADHGADYIHIDIMDGHFVPNMTFGPNMVEAMKRLTTVPLDVHLMISNAESVIEDYVKAGADILTLHQEAVTHLHRAVQQIHGHGILAGVSLNPATPVHTLEDIIEELDLVLIMTVNPGFGGQKFITHGLDKIKQVKDLADRYKKSDLLIEVDGGVNETNAASLIKAGANVLVAGSAVFGKDNPVEAMEQIRKAGQTL